MSPERKLKPPRNKFLNTTNFVAFEESFFDIIGPTAKVGHLLPFLKTPMTRHLATCQSKTHRFLQPGALTTPGNIYSTQRRYNSRISPLAHQPQRPPLCLLPRLVTHRHRWWLTNRIRFYSPSQRNDPESQDTHQQFLPTALPRIQRFGH
jgi:hypothetical protein